MALLYAIDRFDGPEWVVLEDAATRTFSIPRAWIPASAGEGDVLSVRIDSGTHPGTSNLLMAVDADATAQRTKNAHAIRRQLKRGPEGDVSL